MEQNNTAYLYITRHGETKWNLEGRFQGRQDSALTPRGVRQAKNLGRVLDEEKIELILTSPLPRARATAELARGGRPIPIHPLESLSELSLGAWEGARLKDLKEREAQNYHYYWNEPARYVPNGGESYAQMIARLEGALAEIIALGRGKRVLVVTHGMALMGLIHLVTGWEFAKVLRQPVLSQTSITRVEARLGGGDRFTVREIGSTAHFGTEELTSPVTVTGHQGQWEPLYDRAARLLLNKGLTISTAESLTGGLLASELISSSLGISAAFMEGFITYSNEAKVRDLGVEAADLEAYGAVSEQVARQMAAGCQKKSGTDIAIATTGIAGPSGATAHKPIGLTFIAIWHEGQIEIFREIFPGSRSEVRRGAVEFALERLIDLLERGGGNSEVSPVVPFAKFP